MASEAERLLIEWSRDLSTRTVDEIRAIYTKDRVAAIDKLDAEGGGFAGRLKDHNPIYYLAERLFFDNVLGRPEFLDPSFHRDIICASDLEYLVFPDRSVAGHLLLAQRDSFKSTFRHGVLPVFFTLRFYHVEDKHARVALIHQYETQASANLVRIKQRSINSAWFATTWNEFHSQYDFGTKTELTWPCVPLGLFSEHSMIARGLTADLTGFHFDLLCVSDMVNKDHRTSKAQRTDTARKYASLVYTKETTRSWVFVDGTLYHPSDQNARLMNAKRADGKPLYKTVLLGAGGSRVGKPLTLPHRHSEEVIEAKRDEEIANSGNDDLWYLQMQNEIRSKRIMATDPSWLKECSQKDIGRDCFRVITVDPAWKGTANSGEGNSAAIEAWALERRGPLLLKYLLDGVYSNELTDLEGRNEIFRLMKQYFISDVAPEERGGFSLSTNMLTDATTRGIYLNIIKLTSQQTNKTQRIVSFCGEVQAGRVFVCQECDPVLKAAFTDQFNSVPQCIDDEDDAVDAAAYTCDKAILEAYAPRFNRHTGIAPWWKRPMSEPPRTRYCAS